MEIELDARGVPAYVTLVERLQAAVAAGALEAGGPLPPEPDLALRFGVRPDTVRRALGHLEAEGTLTRRPDGCLYVDDAPPIPRPRRREARPANGLLLFARYAYPPNERGYCGPADHRSLLEQATAGVVDGRLAELARAFRGPWPYLQLMAGAAGIDDPFDLRVVEAYWVGNRLLDRVDMGDFGNALAARFRREVGPRWRYLAEWIPAGAVAHHSFHVFGVYPWVGLLDSGRGEPLEILDRCRIRWGRVRSIHGDRVVVEYRPLTWDGRRLDLGEPTVETVVRAVDGHGFVDDLRPGDWVSMHWRWICDRLDRRGLDDLRRYTLLHLEMANVSLAHPGPAMVMG
ncbi:MAG TPA: GntR family transcriptional regulator [Actinobacteria bacterium]|nr:GntR family transcriptional regulator [Actinomycetota bacterium]